MMLFRPGLAVCALLLTGLARAEGGGELRFALSGDPKTLDPLAASEVASFTVAYLTGGTLVRIDRRTGAVQPELATSWSVRNAGRQVVFRTRPNVRFSDGTPFGPEDVAHTVRRILDPATNARMVDSFRTDKGTATAAVTAPNEVTITFPSPQASPERLFDEIPLRSARSPQADRAGLGPFLVASYQPGVSLQLRPNPHYWRRDAQGRALPRLDSIRLDIQQNSEIELARFRRGDLHLLNRLDAETFDRLSREMPNGVRDAGPSLDMEFLWLNLSPRAPIAPHLRAWFASRDFRRALSMAVSRADIARVVYRGRALPGTGLVSPANQAWVNNSLRAHPHDPAAALAALGRAGFRKDGDTLRDREGRAVEFSLVFQAGHRSRERMAAMIQQDLSRIGVRLSLVPLEQRSLIARISRSLDYEACLFGLSNTGSEPADLANVLYSSAPLHAWNPAQATPATPWEAEIDRLLRVAESAAPLKERKAAYDRVQQILMDEAPMLFLAYPHSLVAVRPEVRQAQPAPRWPQAFWNVEQLSVAR